MIRRYLNLAAAAALALLLSGCGYNEIQRQDEQVKAAWSQVLNQYERRADLVPKLVSSVNAYMVNERTVLQQVTDARARVGQIRISADDLSDPALVARFEQAQGALSSSLSRLLAVSENYPQLKSDGLFRDLMTQLEGTENRITVARERYVGAVQTYNLTIREFPTLITARVFGYQPKAQYGLDKADAVMRDPEVKFDLPAPAGAK
ncbi:LemA family protein [uncultured Castellaniella sp.]|uniref:LemA family protein n=1 Tax=uncultured Castellaniella sp. TaxID=647907 RepID=UPI00260BD408|nr:LemA family protein [uncultured Castellaniella sp.]